MLKKFFGTLAEMADLFWAYFIIVPIVGILSNAWDLLKGILTYLWLFLQMLWQLVTFWRQ